MEGCTGGGQCPKKTVTSQKKKLKQDVVLYIFISRHFYVFARVIKGFVSPRHFSTLGPFGDSNSTAGTTENS
jgi:hypothetical protein